MEEGDAGWWERASKVAFLSQREHKHGDLAVETDEADRFDQSSKPRVRENCGALLVLTKGHTGGQS